MIFTEVRMWLIGVAVFIAAIFGVYFKGESVGERKNENKHTRRRIGAMKTAKEVRDEIQDDPYFVDRARQWVRKDDDR
jgi:hypothetical protein